MAKYPNRIQVNLSDILMDRVNVKALSMGVTVPEYIRFTLLNDLDDVDEIDRELLKDLPEAMKDVKNGRVFRTQTPEEAIAVMHSFNEDD